MKVALYARVSKIDQHCELQLNELRAYCQRQGWEVVDLEKPADWKRHKFAKRPARKDGKPVLPTCKVCGQGLNHAVHTGRFGEYVDTLSGKTASRPELNRLMEDARQKRFDTVIVWKLDRFGRSVRNCTEQLSKLDTWGIRFVSATQSMIDTNKADPISKLLMHILMAFAEFEREIIVERVTAGMAAAAHKGIRCGRPKAVVDRAVVQRMKAQGLSLRAIGRKVNVSYATVARLLAVA